METELTEDTLLGGRVQAVAAASRLPRRGRRRAAGRRRRCSGRRARARSRRRRRRRRPLPRRAHARTARCGHRAAAGAGAARRTQCRAQRHERARANDRSRSRPAAAAAISARSTMSPPIRPIWRPPSPIPRPIRARRWPPSNRAPTSRAGSPWRPARRNLQAPCHHPSQRPAGGDRRPPGPAGLGRSRRQAPAARRTRAGAGPPRRLPCSAPRRRRSCCIGRRAATPTRPRRSCATPRRLPSEAARRDSAGHAGMVERPFSSRAGRARRPPVGGHRLGRPAGRPRPVDRIRGAAARARLRTCAAPRRWRWRSIRPAARRCSRR